MRSIDLNCDMGEGMDNDAVIMPYISSASIACGYHAGDETTMRQTMELAMRHGVAVGAHVSFSDRANFGRSEMNLPAQEVYQLVTAQLITAAAIADKTGTMLRHVKPHGALYNQSARDKVLATTIAQAVKDFDASLVLFGLSGSPSIDAAKALGLATASEVFADRMYREDGSLVPRSQPGSLIAATGEATRQVLQMVQRGTVISSSGQTVPVVADTICIHGDGKNAAGFASAIHTALKQYAIEIQPV